MEMGPDAKGLSKRHIFNSVEGSLKRLQTDYIDLYQSHKDDPDTPIEETLAAYNELVNQGKVRFIGASNYNAARLNEALQISKQNNYPIYQTLQPQYNLYDRQSYESDIQQFCIDNNVGVITYYSLASGFLTGKYRSENDFSKSPRGGGIKRFLNKRGFAILSALDQAAKQLNATPAQIALAWLLTHKEINAPIASATSTIQLNDILKSVEIKLDAASVELLKTASSY